MIKLYQKINLKNVLIWGAIFHLLAAIMTEGYHRPDEHLGLMRFMSMKLGLYPASGLSWEFPAMIRPWLQPGIMVLISKFYLSLGFKNPFYWATLLRLISSGLGLYASYQLACESKKELKEISYKMALPLFFLLWYFPFFHARPSAENWGMVFFIFGLVPWLIKPKSSKLLIGLLFGASFIVRFQMAFAIAPLWFWFAIIHKESAKNLALVAAGIVLAIIINIPLDYWGYGVWTFSAWNYFDHNILRGAASGFGVMPWYYYITKIFAKGIPPLSLIFIVPTLWCWIKRPKHWVTWVTLPFFVLHSAVGHKELRFLFGMGMLTPLMLGLMLDDLKLKWSRPLAAFSVLLVVINVAALLASSLRPAFTPIDMYKVLYHHPNPPKAMITFGEFRDQLPFYLQAPIEQIQVEDDETRDLEALAQRLPNPQSSWFLTDKLKDIEILSQNSACSVAYLGYPNWVFNLKRYDLIYKLLEKSKTWALYQCAL